MASVLPILNCTTGAVPSCEAISAMDRILARASGSA